MAYELAIRTISMKPQMFANKLLPIVIGAAFGVCAISISKNVMAAPLSCGMQRTLVQTAAMARDSGMPADQAARSLHKDPELTSLEIDTVIEAAYVVGKNLPPDAIGLATYNSCKKSHILLRSDESKTKGLSCHDIGYRFGYTATRAVRGNSVNPDWDFAVPERCKTVRAVNEGIKAGIAAAK